MHNYPECVSHVLTAEGGLVNDPKDPGGVTKFGISQRSYPAFNIRALSLDAAKAICQRDYWAHAMISRRVWTWWSTIAPPPSSSCKASLPPRGRHHGPAHPGRAPAGRV